MTPSTPLANVEANLFRAAAICAAVEDVRLYIQGVRIEKHPDEGALLVATDGRRLIVIHDKSAWCRRAITVHLNREGLVMCRPRRNEAPRLVIDEDGHATVPERTYRSTEPVLIKEPFPIWQRAVPVRKWLNARVTVSGELLATFGKIAAIFSEHASIQLIGGNVASDGVLVLFPTFHDAFGILMPMHMNMVDAGLPRWMKPVMDAHAKKRKAEAKKTAA